MSAFQPVNLNLASVEREELPVDVVVVGAGPAGLACAIRLKQALAERGRGDAAVLVLEKGEEVGYHVLSGAVMDPRGIAALFPGWRAEGFPIESEVKDDCLEVLRPGGGHLRIAGAFLPPNLKNHGNVIVSLHHVVRWMAQRAEALGVDVYAGFAAAGVLYEGDRVVGVQTRDAGIARDGRPRAQFEPGMNVRAKVTVFAEGPRGNLAKGLIRRLQLDLGRNPPSYETGVKEIWSVPAERGAALAGHVIHTIGHPLGTTGYGGGFVYGLSGSRLCLGHVVGLDHPDPRLDPHALFVQWKEHPAIRTWIEGGELLRYGAKTIPGGGYFSMPRREGDGFVLVGDAAGFLDMARLKGIHLAIESGILAADAIAGALAKGDTSEASLRAYTDGFERSPAKKELWRSRNFRAAFQAGFFAGVLDAAVQAVTGGRGLVARRRFAADHTTTRKIETSTLQKPAFGGPYAADKLTDVYRSGAVHEEDQPPHLVVREPDLCIARCTAEYGNPCQHFCPAAVYEWPHADERAARAAGGVVINAANCVHCKTCDVADPYENIEWVVPEGGGGPKYVDM
ncbi:MAG: electron transfer flavoprotein-ubiquinone oxidoreductase [Planctomycetota bacterium]